MTGILTGKHKILNRNEAIDVYRTFVAECNKREKELSEAYWLDAGATGIVQEVENNMARRIQRQSHDNRVIDDFFPPSYFERRGNTLIFSAMDVLVPTAFIAASELPGGAEKVYIKPHRKSENAAKVLREVSRNAGTWEYIRIIMPDGKKSSAKIAMEAIYNPNFDHIHLVGGTSVSQQWNPVLEKAIKEGKLKTAVIASSGKAPVLYISPEVKFDEVMIEEQHRAQHLKDLDHTPIGVAFLNSIAGNGLYCNFSRVIFVDGGKKRAREFAERFGKLVDKYRPGTTQDSFNGPVKNALAINSCELAAALSKMRGYETVREFRSEPIEYEGGRAHLLNPGVYLLDDSNTTMPWVGPNDNELRKLIRSKYKGIEGILKSIFGLRKARKMASGFELYGPVTYIVPVESKEEFINMMRHHPDLNLVADYFGPRDPELEKELLKFFPGLIGGNKYSPFSEYGPFDPWPTGAGGTIRNGEDKMSHGVYIPAALYSGKKTVDRRRGYVVFNEMTVFGE